MYIDFHTHIDFFKDDELKQVYEDIEKNNIKVISCAMDEKTYKQNIGFSKECPSIIPIFGIHPWSVKSKLENLDIYDDYIKNSVMVGEVGLDFHWVEDKSTFKPQTDVFKHCVKKAKQYDKFLNIHTKGAESLIYDILYTEDMLEKSIIHWYSGDKHTLDKFVDAGCYFTVSVDINHSKFAQEISKAIPVHRILAETDGPTSLEWVNGQYGMPNEIINVYKGIAKIKNVSLEEYKCIVDKSYNYIIKDTNL